MQKSNNIPKKTYYSYSRLWCYLKSPQEYYAKYVMGFWDPPNPKMLLGTIFSDAYSGRQYSDKDPVLVYDWKKALKHPSKYYKDASDNLTYTSDYERKMETALKHPNLVQAKFSDCEQTILLDSNIPLQAKPDAFSESKKLVIENKYGRVWSEQEVKDHDQLTFYSWVVYNKFGFVPKVRMQIVNSSNGNVQFYELKKTKKDFKELEKKIKYAYEGITKEIYE